MSTSLKKISSIVVFTFFLMGNIIATQFFAWKLSYQAALGSFFTIMDKHVYVPWDFFMWFIKFSHDAPKLFSMGFSIIALVTGFGFLIVLAIKRNSPNNSLSSCGTARWATDKEIKESKLLDGKGIYLGKKDGRYLRDYDNKHALLVSPTRGGKGVGHVEPVALSWNESAVFIDIKGEIYSISSGYRKNVLGQTIIKFDPSNPEGSAKFNPLDEIRFFTVKEVKDATNIIDALMTADQSNHWTDMAKKLILGVVIHIKYTQGSVCFGDVLKFLFGETPIEERLFEMTSTIHATTPEQMQLFENDYDVKDGIHPIVKQIGYSFSQKAENGEKEFSGIVSTIEELLKDFTDPILVKNTSRSDFKIRDLMHKDKAVSLYLIVPPSDLHRLSKFFKLIVVLIYQRSTEKMTTKNGQPVKDYKHELLLLLDEFPALGKIDEFQESLGYIAGYGLRAFIIVQGLNQIYNLYGKNNSIIDNCHIRIFHTPNDKETPNYVSESMGTETIAVKNKNYTNDVLQFLGSNNYTVQEKGRELMKAAEISTMSSEDEIILIAGKPPIKCKKIKYFEDENFICKCLPAVKTDSLYFENSTTDIDIPAKDEESTSKSIEVPENQQTYNSASPKFALPAGAVIQNNNVTPDPKPAENKNNVAADPKPAEDKNNVATDPKPAKDKDNVAADPKPAKDKDNVAADPKPAEDKNNVAADPKPIVNEDGDNISPDFLQDLVSKAAVAAFDEDNKDDNDDQDDNDTSDNHKTLNITHDTHNHEIEYDDY